MYLDDERSDSCINYVNPSKVKSFSSLQLTPLSKAAIEVGRKLFVDIHYPLFTLEDNRYMYIIHYVYNILYLMLLLQFCI